MALLDYLYQRRAEVEAQIKALKAELGEIRVAVDALSGNSPAINALHVRAFAHSHKQATIKDWVLKALEGASGGLETDAVIQKVSELGGPPVPRSSMTPQLSRMKASGILMQVGKNWLLSKNLSEPYDEVSRKLDLEGQDKPEDDEDFFRTPADPDYL